MFNMKFLLLLFICMIYNAISNEEKMSVIHVYLRLSVYRLEWIKRLIFLMSRY